MPSNLETVHSPYDQLQRILASQAFRNTEVLKRLLEYLGRKAMAGEGEELKEYIVGVEAFGKRDGYDPKTDSSVRVQAGKLRQKLEEYYRTEGREDPLLVELPKGCFAIRFRELDHPVAAEPRLVSIGESRQKGISWALVMAALAIGAGGWIYALVPPTQKKPASRYAHAALAEFWQPFTGTTRAAIVSLGTPLFVKIAGRFVRNTRINEWEEMVAAGEARRFEQILSGTAAPVHIYTGIGEATGAFELGRLFLSLGKDLNLVPSTVLTWEDIERHNVIFVGPPKYNRQTEDLPATQAFDIRPGRIINLHPSLGEPAEYAQTYGGDQSLLEGHALIARLPGLHGVGVTVLLASPSTEGSRAAVDYVTRPEYVSRLLSSLRVPEGRIPLFFECVVRVRFRSQTPIWMEQVALRTWEKR